MAQDKTVLEVTEQVEKEEQVAEDGKLLDTVMRGAQDVYLEGYGTVHFEFPPTGLALEGDQRQVQYKTEHLRKGTYFTEAELKAIYNKPVVIQVDGKDITVGSGEWTAKDEKEMEDLPVEIEKVHEMFIIHRGDYQQLKQELLSLPNTKKGKDKKKELETKQTNAETLAMQFYEKTLRLKAKLLELQATRVRLFSDSLEEQAFFEKVKLFAPSCIKKKEGDDYVYLWNSEEELLQDKYSATRVLSLFNLFVRGLDVRFFGDAPGEETS